MTRNFLFPSYISNGKRDFSCWCFHFLYSWFSCNLQFGDVFFCFLTFQLFLLIPTEYDLEISRLPASGSFCLFSCIAWLTRPRVERSYSKFQIECLGSVYEHCFLVLAASKALTLSQMSTVSVWKYHNSSPWELCLQNILLQRHKALLQKMNNFQIANPTSITVHLPPAK